MLDGVRLARLQVDDDQLLALIREGNPFSGPAGATKMSIGRPKSPVDPLRTLGAVRREDDESLFSAFVRHGDDPLAVRQPPGQAVAHAGAAGESRRRTFPESHRVDGSAIHGGDRVSLGMKIESFHVLRGRNEFAVSLRSRTHDMDIQLDGIVSLAVEEVQVRSGVVDDPHSIGRRKTNVEVLVVRVPSQIAARDGARVEISKSLMIREEIDAFANPHRVREIPREPDELGERSVSPPVDPERAGRAAAIPLPPRGIAGVASDHDAVTTGFEGEGPRRAHPKRPRRPARGGNRVEVEVPAERLSPIAREDDVLAVRTPARDGALRRRAT